MIGQLLREQQATEFVDSVEFDNVLFDTRASPIAVGVAWVQLTAVGR
jgi:hypothetical protein